MQALPVRPDFIIHTGDVSQLSRPQEFDDAEQMLKATGLPVFTIPGEHDMLDPDGGKAFLGRFGKGSKGAGWYSFDHRGVHFVALVNVADLKPSGMGKLGAEQLKWLAADLAGRPSSTPIVVFAHIPLWTVYADWGWGTDDSAQALKLLARFGSVTVLNGHIHQIAQKVEGRIAFHTTRSLASAFSSAVSSGRRRTINAVASRRSDCLWFQSATQVPMNTPRITMESSTEMATPSWARSFATARLKIIGGPTAACVDHRSL